ncbi:MAG: hypothetical protein EP329_14185 [Deltaproteobacteria bacterium]|nr:MAG: hypothetical protein EP329_14185 [Deltaproteobacteria bacterium]
MKLTLTAAALLLAACGTTSLATPEPMPEEEPALAGSGEACDRDDDCDAGLVCVEDCDAAAWRGARELMAQAMACPSVCRPAAASAPMEEEPEEPVLAEEPPVEEPAPEAPAQVAQIEVNQRDYFVLGVLVVAIIDIQDNDLPQAKRAMQRVLGLMRDHGIDGEARGYADEVVKDLTGDLFANMRVSANLTLLSGEIARRAPSQRLRAVYLAARQSTIIYSYLAQGDMAAAKGLWRELDPSQAAAACRVTGADARIVAFMDDLVARWERGDYSGFVTSYRDSPLPQM